MPFRIILESVDHEISAFLQLLHMQYDIICLNRVSRIFMDAIVCALLHEGYGYVYIEAGETGICTAWRNSIFSATECKTITPECTYDGPIWERVLSFFGKKSQTPTRLSFVRLNQLNTSRDFWVINCTNTEGFITNPHFFNILVGRIVNEMPCIFTGTLKGTIRDEMVLTDWADACSGTHSNDTILSRGGMIQIHETPGHYDKTVMAQFY